MKKMMITLALALTLGASYAFAGGTNVNEQVLTAFKQDFSTAKEVKWSSVEDYFKAEFSYNGQMVAAYYTVDGNMMAVVRNITTLQLPLNLQTGYKKNYNGYWVSDLFEVATDKGTSYYMTLENADGKVVLKSIDSSNWSVYDKSKKA
jgi:hypothetical protein